MAVARSNNPDAFLKFWERALELNFKVDYGFPLPSQQAFVTLFGKLKRQGSLLYMPQLNERAQQALIEESGDEEESNGSDN